MHAEEIQIETADGLSLAGTHYLAGGSDEVIVMASAMGVPRQYYKRFAAVAVESGFSVMTFDYRLIGADVADLKSAEGSLTDWGRYDLAAVIECASSGSSQRDVYLVAHSVGGQMLGFASSHSKIQAALCHASAHGYYKNWPASEHERLRNYWTRIVPESVAENGYFPGASLGTANLPESMALEWARWCLSPHYFCDEDGKRLEAHFRSVDTPMLFLPAEDDLMAPPESLEALRKCYPNAKTELEVLRPSDFGGAPIGHFNYFRDEVFAGDWRRRLGWLRLAGAGADRTGNHTNQARPVDDPV